MRPNRATRWDGIVWLVGWDSWGAIGLPRFEWCDCNFLFPITLSSSPLLLNLLINFAAIFPKFHFFPNYFQS